MNRAKKLKLTQLTLLIIGLLIIFFTYSERERSNQKKIISSEVQKKIDTQLRTQSNDENIFYNVLYSGLDLEGNRYTITSEEASSNKTNINIIRMIKVKATFYFKDDTILYVVSDTGLYNNKTLDMIFKKNVNATYQNSELTAEKAEFSNSKSFLIVSEGVKIKDLRGTMYADKLLFDIKKKTLNIASFDNNKINTTVKYKWKKVLEF